MTMTNWNGIPKVHPRCYLRSMSGTEISECLSQHSHGKTSGMPRCKSPSILANMDEEFRHYGLEFERPNSNPSSSSVATVASRNEENKKSSSGDAKEDADIVFVKEVKVDKTRTTRAPTPDVEVEESIILSSDTDGEEGVDPISSSRNTESAPITMASNFSGNSDVDRRLSLDNNPGSTPAILQQRKRTDVGNSRGMSMNKPVGESSGISSETVNRPVSSRKSTSTVSQNQLNNEGRNQVNNVSEPWQSQAIWSPIESQKRQAFIDFINDPTGSRKRNSNETESGHSSGKKRKDQHEIITLDEEVDMPVWMQDGYTRRSENYIHAGTREPEPEPSFSFPSFMNNPDCVQNSNLNTGNDWTHTNNERNPLTSQHGEQIQVESTFERRRERMISNIPVNNQKDSENPQDSLNGDQQTESRKINSSNDDGTKTWKEGLSESSFNRSRDDRERVRGEDSKSNSRRGDGGERTSRSFSESTRRNRVEEERQTHSRGDRRGRYDNYSVRGRDHDTRRGERSNEIERRHNHRPYESGRNYSQHCDREEQNYIGHRHGGNRSDNNYGRKDDERDRYKDGEKKRIWNHRSETYVPTRRDSQDKRYNSYNDRREETQDRNFKRQNGGSGGYSKSHNSQSSRMESDVRSRSTTPNYVGRNQHEATNSRYEATNDSQRNSNQKNMSSPRSTDHPHTVTSSVCPNNSVVSLKDKADAEPPFLGGRKRISRVVSDEPINPISNPQSNIRTASNSTALSVPTTTRMPVRSPFESKGLGRGRDQSSERNRAENIIRQILETIKTCSQCDGRVFDTRKDAVLHLKKEHEMKPCYVCYEAFSEKGHVLKEHFIKHHARNNKDEKANCPVCMERFNIDGMRIHICKNHLKPYEVAFCQRSKKQPNAGARSNREFDTPNNGKGPLAGNSRNFTRDANQRFNSSNQNQQFRSKNKGFNKVSNEETRDNTQESLFQKPSTFAANSNKTDNPEHNLIHASRKSTYKIPKKKKG